MNERLREYIEHMRIAASDACGFVDGMSKSEFLGDKRTQQAVIMSLIIIGEAATKLMDGYSDFTDRHAEIPWRSMRGMRNRVAHGYFETDVEIVWDTVQKALPDLLAELGGISELRGKEDGSNSV